MLEVKDLTIYIGDRCLIKDLSFVLNAKDKLAIIGEEGNGKSTLLKAIVNRADFASVSGSINNRGNTIGYLEQSMSNENLDKTVYDYLFDDEYDYYSKINDFYRYIEFFNMNEKIVKQKIRTLSGGEKVKVGILRLMLIDYDILLLDEPTNDLDIDALRWLEDFIIKSGKPIIYVSHDETLLSKTANCILHIEQIMKKTEPKYTYSRTNYDSYVKNRVRNIEKTTQVAKNEKREKDKAEEKLRKIMQKVENAQNSISRSDPHGAKMLKRKMGSLKSQEKRLNEKELVQVPDVEEAINFFFEEVDMPRKKIILDINIDELKVEDNILSSNVRLKVVGNEHICIIGKNGVGKSTLIKKIYDELKDRTDINVGYMPQEYDDILGKCENVIDFICDSKDKESITKARMFLGNMNFTRDEMTGKIDNISNGTKAKLILMKLVLNKCDVLVLDEPTRNVSPLSNPVIRRVLKNFNGTIISVSHDRKYIKEVSETLYELTSDGLVKRDKKDYSY